MYDHDSAWEIMKVYILSGFMAMFGALAHVIYAVRNGRSFSYTFLFITLFFGFFVGNLIGSFLPKDFAYRDGVLMIAGFGCYPILEFLEKNIPELTQKLVDRLMGK
jgi:hypothetical protein